MNRTVRNAIRKLVKLDAMSLTSPERRALARRELTSGERAALAWYRDRLNARVGASWERNGLHYHVVGVECPFGDEP